MDLIIDLFVTIRLVQILNKASKNAYILDPERTTYFTSVKYWNYTRLMITILYHIMTMINAILYNSINGLTIVFIFTFIYISLSYIITYDAKIVKIIDKQYKNIKKSHESIISTYL